MTTNREETKEHVHESWHLVVYIRNAQPIALKKQIHDKTGIPPSQQTLRFRQKALENTKTLAQSNIHKGDTLLLELINTNNSSDKSNVTQIIVKIYLSNIIVL